MVEDRSSNGLRRILTFALPLLAVLCVAGIAMTTGATLDEEEPPNQYQDFDNAYGMITAELGTTLEIRKDGGGDADFLKLGFLDPNDIVTVTVNQSEPTTMVEYLVSDPNKFPIHFFSYQGQIEPNFTFEFAVVTPGPYYIHTGQGFGDTFINMTIDRIPISSPPQEKDGNNAPANKKPLSDGVTERRNAGLPWDPSDFYYIHIDPSLAVNKYLTIKIETAVDTDIQWELYNSTGIQRPSLTYSSDTLTFGSDELREKRIFETDDYIIRIWMMGGYGQYNLTVTVLSYSNDMDNSREEATTLVDNGEDSGDVNLSFDRDDYYKIYLTLGDPLWVRMTPDKGPADLLILDADGNQKDISNEPGLEVEFIDPYYAKEEGWYYIVVEAVYEAPKYENPPTVDYTLEVWINYWPHVENSIKRYHIDEDVPDSDFNVSSIFADEDGDPLTYDLDSSYNDTLIDIQLIQVGDYHFLQLTPVKDASGFKVGILLNATDPHGLMVNSTSTIWVDQVNDPPFVNQSEVPEEITMGEDLVKSGVNVTKPFRDVDDDYSTWTFQVDSSEHIHVQLDEETLLVTLTILEDHWFGTETFNVTCIDSEGESVTIVYTVTVLEINDPPLILRHIAPFKMDEESTVTFDLEDEPEGPYFMDIEGKPMTYEVLNNGSITATIEGSVLTFTGQKDFTGSVSDIILRAIDELGHKSLNMSLFITVEDLPDPPELTKLIETANVQEDGEVVFAQDVYYDIVDKDSDLFDLEWVWYVDDAVIPAVQIDDKYNFAYRPEITAEKERTVMVKLEVIDGELEPQSVVWPVTVTNLNQAPHNVTISSQSGKTTFKEGDAIQFTVSAEDLDGDDLTYKWFLDELEEVGTGPNLNLGTVKLGSHKISVEATDANGATTEADLTFNVQRSGSGEDGGGLSMMVIGIIAAVVVILVVVVLIAVFLRKGGTEE